MLFGTICVLTILQHTFGTEQRTYASVLQMKSPLLSMFAMQNCVVLAYACWISHYEVMCSLGSCLAVMVQDSHRAAAPLWLQEGGQGST